MNSVNSFVRSVLDDLVDKRLWPIAAALVVALVAIPVLLSKSAGTEPATAPAPATPAVAATGGPLSAFQPVVNTQGKKSSEIRKNLKAFESKDPFRPQGLTGGGGSGSTSGSVQVQGADVSAGSTSTGSGNTTPDSGSSTGSSGESTSGSGTSIQPPTKPQTFYYTYAADVRFGKEDNLDRKTLQQFRSLPSSQNPVLVFMGVKEDGETAIFLQSSAATSTGEGNCEPDDTCTFLYMKKGDEQRIEAVGENDEVITYKLVLLDIVVKRTDGPEKTTSSSRSKRSKRSVEDAKGHTNPFARGFQAIGF
jgi:hypothetical protein